MIDQETLIAAIPQALDSLDLPEFGTRIEGKVRDAYTLDDRRILIATDRISAFDRVLGLIPHRGQVLNQLSAWWFDHTADIVPNHLLDVPDPNVTIARNAQTIPVEVVVRGYITGVTSTSLWTLYANGDRTPYGIPLPDGLQKNDPLPMAIITPTTKASTGHDERITGGEVVARGLLTREQWQQVQSVALSLFARGQERAREAGLILVDTKYEFGFVDDTLTLIDEVHTPDSSRYWTVASYDAGEPENYSKEYLREWFKARGYGGDGPPPAMPADFIAQVAARYIAVYEMLTGMDFTPGEQPIHRRIQTALVDYVHA